MIEKIKKMGPGLLMAGAAIGVSHIVQSTRAGANFGYQLLLVVLLANVLKYPFFEFGHRFAIATGDNLLVGYKKLGKVFLYAFLLLSIFTALGTMAGVTYVTGALAYNLFGQSLSVFYWSLIVLLVCAAILVVGHYDFLDRFMKWVMGVLFIATLTSFVAALIKGPVGQPSFLGSEAYSAASLPFLIALMGWMPAPVETSVWTSLWVQAKGRHEKMTWAEAKFDFNFGYISTLLLALVFVMLGAMVMFGSGVSFSNSGSGFAAQVVELYTKNLGEWSRPIIAFSAFSTMFSTTITCLDAYPRSLTTATEIAFEDVKMESCRLKAWLQPRDRRTYYFWLLWSGLGSLVVIGVFTAGIKVLVDFVTTAAFLTAPIFAFMNYKLIFSDILPKDFRPSFPIKLLCWLGLVYLVGFSLFFFAQKF